MGKRRRARILQRATSPNAEDCPELSIAFDDKGESYENHMGANDSPEEVLVDNKTEVEELLKANANDAIESVTWQQSQF